MRTQSRGGMRNKKKSAGTIRPKKSPRNGGHCLWAGNPPRNCKKACQGRLGAGNGFLLPPALHLGDILLRIRLEGFHVLGGREEVDHVVELVRIRSRHHVQLLFAHRIH